MAEALLFELATEEIPAAYQKNLLSEWQRKLPPLLKATGIPHGGIHVYATARRIAFVVENIHEQGEDITQTLQGPAKSAAFTPDGKPSPALLGFAKKVGIEPTHIEFQDTGKGLYAVATTVRKGALLREALPPLLHTLLTVFRFPRSMRWSDGPTVYARPIAGYFVMYGKAEWDFPHTALKGTVLEVIPRRPVRGHFILDKEPIAVESATAYRAALEKHGIVADVSERRALIERQLKEAAAQKGLHLVENEALLDEVNFIVERPSVLVASFSADYLRLPDGVILSEMNQHQRYFGLREGKKLSNQFLIVTNANTKNTTAAHNIRSGNERVLRARLSDGAFFYDEDLKKPLAERVDDLTQIVFHEGLGTYREKVERMARFAALFDAQSFSTAVLEKSARLAKADLTTQLVFEFDHLQGEIGAQYAAKSGVEAEICTAISEHYQPRFQGDTLPSTRLGALLSLADKWDNMLAAFVLGKEPTASQDPFAIRRQALYIIQILAAQKIRVSLATVIKASLEGYPHAEGVQGVHEKILQFFKARLVTIFEVEGFDKKLTRAAIYTGSDDVCDLFTRAAAIKSIAEKDAASFTALLTAFKRMAHIVGAVKSGRAVDASIFTDPAEKNLHAFATRLHELSRAPENVSIEYYQKIFTEFAAGKNVVDTFFEKVMVNHDDEKVKQNRIALLLLTLSAVENLIALEELT
ncbi:MAG TPA: glycine--tRNA ligase subunit beta [Turneriella sp.]|nr:glycine--tRNA ligase subunit beta [Turneriella sp.]